VFCQCLPQSVPVFIKKIDISIDEKVQDKNEDDERPCQEAAHCKEQKDNVKENLFHACLQKAGYSLRLWDAGD
jgi:hypothetical protein